MTLAKKRGSSAPQKGNNAKKFKKPHIDIKTHSKTAKGAADKSDEKTGGKPEWAGIKQKHKEVTEQRKLKRNATIHTQLSEAKKIFEVIRSSKCTAAEREQHVKKLAIAIKGNLMKMVMRHDMARVIQWILKLGPPSIKEEVVTEIISDIVPLAQNKYSNHIVKCIMKSCNSKIRRQLIKNCMGSIIKLLNSKVSAPIIEDIFSNFANHQERIAFKIEMYGGLLKNLKEPDFKKALDENPSLKPAILSKMNSLLNQLLSKKWSYNSNLVMSTVSDFLQNCEEKDKTQLLETIRSDICLLIKTKYGASIGFDLIWNSSAKAKKEIVKEIKNELKDLAMNEAGSMFLLTLIDSVDDTVLMKKALLPTIIENAETLIQNEHGKKVILYLFSHRDAHFFHPSYVEKLKLADSSINVKKSHEKRLNELQEFCLTPIVNQIRDNPKVWLSDGSTGLITAAILRQASVSSSSQTEVFTSLANFLTNIDNVVTKGDKTINIIEDGGVHKTLKQIIKHDKVLHEAGKGTLSHALVTALSSETLEKWLTFNRGCFTLVFILETEIETVFSLLKEKIKTVKSFKDLKKSELKGANILFEKAEQLKFI